MAWLRDYQHAAVSHGVQSALATTSLADTAATAGHVADQSGRAHWHPARHQQQSNADFAGKLLAGRFDNQQIAIGVLQYPLGSVADQGIFEVATGDGTHDQQINGFLLYKLRNGFLRHTAQQMALLYSRFMLTHQLVKGLTVA